MFLGNAMKRITLKNITMVFVIIASAIYIGKNSTGVFKYIGETSNDVMSMWLVNMYVEGTINKLRITDENVIKPGWDHLKSYLEYSIEMDKPIRIDSINLIKQPHYPEKPITQKQSGKGNNFKRKLKYKLEDYGLTPEMVMGIPLQAKPANLIVILKNTSSKTLPVICSINFYDKNDNLFLEKNPFPFTWLDGGKVDTLHAQYFSLPKNQIERIKRYELKVFYNKVEKRKGLH